MKERREVVPINPLSEKTAIERPFEPKSAPEVDQYRMYRGAVAEEGIRLTDYWRAIRKRLWLVIGIAALVTTLTAIYVSRRPNYYDAKATVQVDLEQENPDLGGVGKDRRPALGNPDPAYFNTQLQILTSASLLRRVTKELDLENSKDFDLGKTDDSRSTLQTVLTTIGLAAKTEKEVVPVASTSTAATGEDLAEAKRMQPYVEALRKKLTVTPVRESRQTNKETRLIEVAFQHNNPEFAAVLVNKIAEVFTKNNEEKRKKTNSTTNSYLKDRIASLQAEIKKDEIQLVKDTRGAGVLNLGDKEGTKTLALTSLELLNKNLIDAENERKNAEAQYNSAKKTPEALNSLAEDTQARRYIDDTKSKINDLQKDRERLLQENTEELPEVKAIDKQITILTKELSDYRQRNSEFLLQSFLTKYNKAKEAEDKIRVEFNRQLGEAQGQNQSAIELKLLDQKIQSNKGLLENLYNQSRTNDVVGAGTENNISVVDSAVPPDKPTGPARLSTVVIAGLMSLMFGCGLALFLEFLDDTLRTTEDIENYLRLPAIAVIPTIDSVPKRKLLLAGGGNTKGNSTYEKNELLIKNDSRSSLAEAYRQLRTSVLLSTAGHAPKSLLITSSVPSEGKTTNAVNTAISLAQTGARVLIIDADMRRPRLHNIFQKPNQQGLSTILSSEMNEESIIDILQHDEATSLFLLPSGPVPPNPAELIGSEQMTKLIRTMERNFTHVIIDSPPIASFTDGVLISTMVDGVLLVVHAGKSSRNVVKRSRQLLLDVGAKIFGVVLNNVNIKSQENYYYYQSYQYQSHYDNQDKD